MDISSMPSFPPIKVGDRQLSDMELSDMDIYGEFCFTELLYIEESVWGYQPGGYHPVAIGDSFKDGRYEVYHKLGHGYHSTVWLARDKSSVLRNPLPFSKLIVAKCCSGYIYGLH